MVMVEKFGLCDLPVPHTQKLLLHLLTSTMTQISVFKTKYLEWSWFFFEQVSEAHSENCLHSVCDLATSFYNSFLAPQNYRPTFKLCPGLRTLTKYEDNFSEYENQLTPGMEMPC